MSFIAFCGFIIWLVIQAFQTDFYLTTEDYYLQELNFQDHIEAKENAMKLTELPVLSGDQDNIYLTFPDNHTPEMGQLHLYRPDNANLDGKFELTNGLTTVSKQELAAGRYIAKISWEKEEKVFYFEKEIRLKK